ncbi:MAG: hypothetical protein ACFB21_08730 [Opitutales bacterium]
MNAPFTLRLFQRFGLAGSLLAGIALSGGCQTAQVGEPLTAELAGSSPEEQMDFWHSLHQRPVACNDEAFHAILLFFDGEVSANSYNGRVDALQSRGWLPSGFSEPAESAVTRGTLSVILAQALEIQGGVWMRIFGPSPRYATRELEHLRLLADSSPQQSISGDMLIGLISRAEDYQRAHNLRAPAPQLPPAPEVEE